jgi:hypothetical protein
MQITSVRYRELVSLRDCEHKALEATVGPASRRATPAAPYPCCRLCL